MYGFCNAIWMMCRKDQCKFALSAMLWLLLDRWYSYMIYMNNIVKWKLAFRNLWKFTIAGFNEALSTLELNSNFANPTVCPLIDQVTVIFSRQHQGVLKDGWYCELGLFIPKRKSWQKTFSYLWIPVKSNKAPMPAMFYI